MRGRIFLTSVVVCLLSGAAVMAAVPAAGAPTPKQRRFEFTYVVRVPSTNGQELRLWVPLPHSDHFQRIWHLRIESPIRGVMEHSSQGNREAYFVLKSEALKRPTEIRIRFDAIRWERSVRLADPKANVAIPASLADYLKPDRMIQLNGIIGQISREQTRGMQDRLAEARKLYNYVIAHMRYDKKGTGWGRGDAMWACSSHRGNCTDFHSLFIGLVRAAGIPARFEIGFPLPPDKSSGRVEGYHCWAEFYLQGVGWVPIDAAEAWLHPKLHNFYFGSLDPDRVRFTMGRDLWLKPRQGGQSLNYFIYPYAELDGKPFKGVKSEFQFHDIR